MRHTWVPSLGQEDPWRRKWQPTQVFLPGKANRQRRLAGYSPWDHKELDMVGQMSTKCLTELKNTSIKHDPSNCACSSNSFFIDNRTNFPSEFPGRVNQNNIFPEDINKIPYVCLHARSLQSCPTLCDPMDCGSPGSSVHGILQARILEWVAISFSKLFPIIPHELEILLKQKLSTPCLHFLYKLNVGEP